MGFGGDRAGDEGTGASSGARVVEGNEALSSGGRRIRRRNAATFPPEVMAKVMDMCASFFLLAETPKMQQGHGNLPFVGDATLRLLLRV